MNVVRDSRWRDGRVVEGARLESVFRGNSNEGSNPSLSARFFSVLSDTDIRAGNSIPKIVKRPGTEKNQVKRVTCAGRRPAESRVIFGGKPVVSEEIRRSWLQELFTTLPATRARKRKRRVSIRRANRFAGSFPTSAAQWGRSLPTKVPGGTTRCKFHRKQPALQALFLRRLEPQSAKTCR